jgi:cytochrome P450
MLSSATGTTSFYPPFVRPSSKPLRFPLNLVQLVRNNLSVVPEQAYRENLAISPGPPRLAFVTGSDLVETMLLDRAGEFPKGELQVGALKPLFGNAMASAEGREWRWQRGAAAPLFRHDELLRYGPIVYEAADATVARWQAAAPGTVHPVSQDMSRVTFQVISKTMLAGVPDDVLDVIEKGYADFYRGANWLVLYTLLQLPGWVPRPGGKAMRAHEWRLREAVGDLVHARRANAGGGDDLLARMMRSSDPETGRSMSDDLLVDNVLALLTGGSDTASLTLTWTLYLIARSPLWEERMLEEIERVVGSGPVTAEHVHKLVTVQQVLNESLRLFPTAPVLVRDIREDIVLDGVTVPAGTVAIIPIYAIHRHRKYWDDPDRFDPDRFAPGRPKPPRYQFMPFGAGPRICIGAAFAMIESTILLATFVRAARFEIDPDFDPQPNGRMFLHPKHGMPMRITLRGARSANAA